MCQGTILTVPILCHLFAFLGEEGQEDCETNGGKSHRNEDAASECFIRALNGMIANSASKSH